MLSECSAEVPQRCSGDEGGLCDTVEDVLRALNETVRMLSQRSAQVLALPRPERLGRAMAVLDALGIVVSDLVPPGRR